MKILTFNTLSLFWFHENVNFQHKVQFPTDQAWYYAPFVKKKKTQLFPNTFASQESNIHPTLKKKKKVKWLFCQTVIFTTEDQLLMTDFVSQYLFTFITEGSFLMTELDKNIYHRTSFPNGSLCFIEPFHSPFRIVQTCINLRRTEVYDVITF